MPTLPAQMTPEQRLDTWRHWHSRGRGIEITTTCSTKGGCVKRRAAILELEGGVEVRDPEDLRTFVHQDSKAGGALKKIASAKSSRETYEMVTAAGAVIGLVGVIREDQTGNENWFYYGGGVGLVVALVGAIGVYMRNDDIQEASTEMFENYDAGLAQRLDLCVKGYAIVPCEIGVPGTLSVPINPDSSIVRQLPQR